MTGKREPLEVEIYIMLREYWLLFLVRGDETDKIYYMTTYRFGKEKECAKRFFKFYNYENGFDVGKPKNEQEYFDMDESGKYEGISSYIRVLSTPLTDKKTGRIDFNRVFDEFFLKDVKKGKLTLWVERQQISTNTELEQSLAQGVFGLD